MARQIARHHGIALGQQRHHIAQAQVVGVEDGADMQPGIERARERTRVIAQMQGGRAGSLVDGTWTSPSSPWAKFRLSLARL